MPVTESQQDEGQLIGTTSWRIVWILHIVTAIAAGLLIATGIVARSGNTESPADHSNIQGH